MITQSDFIARWSQLHNNAETSGIVGGWLKISYRIGLICTLLRITPNALTLFGLLGAIAMAFTPHSWLAVALLVFSLFCDGIDGSVAIFQKRESAMGALMDSLADRVVEALWLYVLYTLGAPSLLVLSLWLLGAVQEYARARMESLGVKSIDVVTLTERPMRASYIFIALVLWHLIGSDAITPVAAIYLALQIISVLQVSRSAYQSLRSPSRH